MIFHVFVYRKLSKAMNGISNNLHACYSPIQRISVESLLHTNHEVDFNGVVKHYRGMFVKFIKLAIMILNLPHSVLY